MVLPLVSSKDSEGWDFQHRYWHTSMYSLTQTQLIPRAAHQWSTRKINTLSHQTGLLLHTLPSPHHMLSESYDHAHLHVVLKIGNEEGHVDSELPERTHRPQFAAHLDVPGLLEEDLCSSHSQEDSKNSIVPERLDGSKTRPCSKW